MLQVNMQIERVNQGVQININAEPGIDVRINGGMFNQQVEEQQSTIARLRDLMAVPAIAGTMWGLYEISIVGADISGVNLSTIATVLLGVGTGAGTLYASETARNGVASTLNFLGRAARSTARVSGTALIGLSDISNQIFTTIGHGTELTARAFPAQTGAVVVGGAAYAAHQSGLDAFAVQQILNTAAVVANFINTDPSNTQYPEL